MFATLHDKTINLSDNIAQAFTGVTKGYRVQLHAMPEFTFNVATESADSAHAAALALCKREGKHIAQTGATIQRIAN